MIEVRELRYFVALAEKLHFGRAAEEVHIAQSALSHAIQRLEQKLGLPLFDRSTRAVSLTEYGDALLPAARAALQGVDHFESTAHELKGGTAGRLIIGYAPSGRVTSGRLLRQFVADNPSVHVTHLQQYSAGLIQSVANHVIDIGVVSSALNIPESLESDSIFQLPVRCLVSNGHPLAGRGTISFEDLSPYPVICLASSKDHGWLEFLMSLYSDRDMTEPRVIWISDPVAIFTASSLNSVEQPIWLQALEYPHGEATVLDFGEQILCDFSVVWARDAVRPAMKAFLEFATSFGSSPN